MFLADRGIDTDKQSILRILTGTKHPKVKLQRLRKIQIWTFGLQLHQINTFYEVLKLKQIFQKNKEVTGKLHFW